MRYALVMHDGVGPAVPPDGTEPTVTSLRDAIEQFRIFCRLMYATSDAYAWLYPAECWDEISYGDNGMYVLTLGPRGGIVVQKP